MTLAQRWALPFLRAGRQTIVFGRSRVAVELLLTGLRESLRESRGPRTRVRGYRGGYLPTERRAIEHGLRDGEILGVVATNALELGVDIGRLDASILAGYPGSVAATWQQFGRAGRRQETSVAVLVGSGAPVDQYVIHHPEFLLDGTPEEARLDPDNLHVLLAHLRAATFELPFDPGEVFGSTPVDDLLAFLAEEGHVRQAGDGRWYWSSENFPASEISLRTAAPENVVIIDTSPDRPRVLGEVDLFSAQVLVHERAIYIHESVQYYVDRLEWGERKAYVHKIDVDHYTYANRAVTLKPLEKFAEAPATGGSRVHGEVMVASLVTLFKKLKFLTDENVGWGPIDLPELELQTTAYWLTVEGSRGRWRTRRARRRTAWSRTCDPDRRSDPADGGPARPWSRHAGPLAPCRGADDLPVRGGSRWDRAVGTSLGAPRRAGDGRRRPGRVVRMRGWLSVVHRSASRTRRRRASAGASPPSRAHTGCTRSRRRGLIRVALASTALDRRLARYRAATRGGRVTAPARANPGAVELAMRLAEAIDGEVVRTSEGVVVRAEPPARAVPVDRVRLAALPGQPPADVPLVCLDTETTGLATAAGTVAFLIGLGWWEQDHFRQVQLLLPEHAEERALLSAARGGDPG